MPVLLYLIILVSIAVGAYFMYKQRGCALFVCSKKSETNVATAPRTANLPTENSSVRKRAVATESDVATANAAVTALKTAVPPNRDNSKGSDYLDPNAPPPANSDATADGKPIDAVVGGVDPLASVKDTIADAPVTAVAASSSSGGSLPGTTSSEGSFPTATSSGVSVDKKKKKKSKKNKTKDGKTKSGKKSKKSKNSKPKMVKQEAYIASQ